MQFKNTHGFYDLERAKDVNELDHLMQSDIDSYWLYKGFYEESIRLDANRTELEKDKELQFTDDYSTFKGVRNLIAKPMHRVMKVQSRGVSKRNENMKEFKIVSALAGVMTDVPERLIHVNRISKKQMKFVLMKAWPLKKIDVMHQVPDIMDNYEALSDAYYDDDWEEMGIQGAKIALKLHEDQKVVNGDLFVEKEDEFMRDGDHSWYGIDED